MSEQHVLPLDLSGKRALVCGASQGIGLAAAQQLAGLGAQVTLLARNLERLEAALATLPGEGHTVAVADFQDSADVSRAAAKVLALESASQLQDAAAVLCVSRADVGGGGEEGLPRSVGQQLRGTEMAGFWSWLRSDQPKGRGAAAKKKSIDRLQSFVDALE